MNVLRRFLDLNGKDRRLLLAALPVVGAARLALWLAPFGTVHRLTDKIVAKVRKSEPDVAIKPARIVWLTGLACRLVPGAHCLTRSMAAQVFLSSHGYPTVLQIGVRKEGGGLDAHAWLEHDGSPLFEDIAHIDRFTPLASSGLADEALQAIK
jgi:hypothetical protein